VRAVWDEQKAKWWSTVLDIVAVLNNQDDCTETCNYWKYLKAKLKKEESEVVGATTQLKLFAPVIKKALTTKINDREMFMKGIDYSYYFEENNRSEKQHIAFCEIFHCSSIVFDIKLKIDYWLSLKSYIYELQ
jgi:hypothetical protein